MKFTDLPRHKMQRILSKLPDANTFKGDLFKFDITNYSCSVEPLKNDATKEVRVHAVTFKKERFIDNLGLPFYDWVLN